MIERFNRKFAFALGALTFTMCAQTISASPILDINVLPATVVPGQTGVAVLGTVTNNTGDVVYINGDSTNLAANLAIPGSVVDFFLETAPLSLANGGTTGLIELFTFDVPANPPLGSFNAGAFQVLGGIGAANQANFDVVGSQNVQVTATPEPEGVAYSIIGLGLLGMVAAMRSVRRRTET